MIHYSDCVVILRAPYPSPEGSLRAVGNPSARSLRVTAGSTLRMTGIIKGSMLVEFPKPEQPSAAAPTPETRVYRLRLRGGGPLLLVLSLAAFLMTAEAVTRLARLTEPRASGYAPVNTELLANRHENARGYRDDERSLAK